MKYTLSIKEVFSVNILIWLSYYLWQGVGILSAIYGVIFGFGYWYVFIHAYN